MTTDLLHNVRKLDTQFYLFFTLASMFILITEMDSALANPLLVLLSLPMLVRPVTLVPMLFISSWNMMFDIFGLGAFFYYFILFFIAMVSHHRQYGQYIGFTPTTLLTLLFGTYILISSFFSVAHEVGSSVRLMFTIFSVVFVGLFRCRDRDSLYPSLFWVALAASIFFGILMQTAPVTFIREDEVMGVVKINTRPTLMSGVNPNNAAQIIAVLSIILIVSLSRLRHVKVLTILVLLLNLSTLISLASRTSFYALGISFVFYLVFASNISRSRKILFILLTVAGMVLLFRFIDSIESRLFVTKALEDNGSGRFVNWALFWKEIVPDYWLHGIGFGRENYRQLGFLFDADNLYVDLLCQLGILGSVLFCLQHFRVMQRVNAARKGNMDLEAIFFILLCYLVFGFGESVFDTSHYWAALLLAYALLSDEDTPDTDNQQPLP